MKEFRGRSVLVTGHTGFKGSWLALWLHRLGAEVHGYSLAPGRPSLFEQAGLRELLATHTVADVRDSAAVERALRESKAEIVFHLAAQSLVRPSYREPKETFETNVLGTVNVLDAVRKLGTVRVCQIVTSDKCYENHEGKEPYRESDPLGGYDPYSASKGCAELVVAAYRRAFFHPERFAAHRVSLSSVRAGNVIGGGDWSEDRLLPDCIRALERGEAVTVRNPGSTRPWQFVLDPLSAYLRLAARQWSEGAAHSDSFNIGPDASSVVPVSALVDQVVSAWGAGTWRSAGREGAAPHEAGMLALDTTKAALKLGWSPTYGVQDAVRETVRWYRERHQRRAGFGARELCLTQIEEFERRACAPERR